MFVGHPALLAVNSPQVYITMMPLSDQLPSFWLAAGAQDPGDISAAAGFRQVLQTRQAVVPLIIVPGGHQGNVWREALGPMFTWMTPQLAAQAAKAPAASPGQTNAPPTGPPSRRRSDAVSR